MIRPGTRDDLPDIIRMGRAFYDRSGVETRGLRFDEESFRLHVESLMDSPTACVFVAEADGRVVGMISGISAPWFADLDQAIAMENWWWVDEDYRNLRLDKGLLDALSDWGRANGISFLIVVALESTRHATLVEYYGRKGFVHLETHFIKEL